MHLHLIITSCRAHTEARKACRETWLAGSLPEGVSYAFVIGGVEEPENEPDVTLLRRVPDDYYGLVNKVVVALYRALSIPGWEWLGKCDDDTYLHLPRAVELLEAQPPDIHGVGLGVGGLGEIPWVMGGAGYFLRREAVETIIARAKSGEWKIPPLVAEDHAISTATVRAGYKWHYTDRLHQYGPPQYWPLPENNSISAHKISPAMMREIQTHWNTDNPLPNT